MIKKNLATAANFLIHILLIKTGIDKKSERLYSLYF